MSYTITSRFIFVCFAAIYAWVLSSLPIGWMVGLGAGYFSLLSLIALVVAPYIGCAHTIQLVLFTRIVKFLVTGISWFSPCSWYLPTIIAAWYLSSSKTIFKLMVPVSCMILFWFHPVGGSVWYYSLYWLIPVGTLLVPQGKWVDSFGAVFVQHAIGSVIWLYVKPTTPALWISLIPIVLFERVLLATGMYVVTYGIDKCWHWIMATQGMKNKGLHIISE